MSSAEADIVVGKAPVAGAGWASRALISTPLLGLVVAALTWPIASIVPATGPDASWMASLYMAHGEGLQFGRDIVFTYGPLGFLEVPVLYEQTMWVVAFAYQAIVHVALAVSLIWIARRALPLPIALAACYCLLVMGRLQAAVVLLAFIWCIAALGNRALPFAPSVVAVGGGVLAAVELLGKANYGVAILGFATLTVLGLPDRRRNLPLFAGAAAGAFALAWVATGQDLGNILAFVAHSAQVISGYSSSMGTDVVAADWERPAAMAAIALLLVATGLGGWSDPMPRRLTSLALVALFSFLCFKQGFVRQGLGNTPEFFILVAGAGIAVASRLPNARFGAAAVVLTASLVGLALVALPSPSLLTSLKPQAHVESLRQGFDALLLAGRRDRLVSEARRSMRSTYGLDPRFVRALGDTPVHIDPWEVGVAWAYDLNWQPLSVNQSYSAYTPELDELNASALAGVDGPEAILRHRMLEPVGDNRGSIDDRYPGWESPAAMRAMLCHFRVTRTGARWQLLDRVSDRCGSPQAIGVVKAETGSPISIPPRPRPNDLVFAQIEGIGVEGWESARSALYRARIRTVTFGAGESWRFAPETAGDGVILRVPSAIDYPRPFRLAPDVNTMSLWIEGGASRRLTVRFFAQRIDRTPPADAGLERRRSTAAQSRPDRSR